MARLERWLAYLGTLGNNAPFIGLFGTVIGVIGAFEELGHGAEPAAGRQRRAVASHPVMASIAEALVATAVGILVALPAVAAFNYFQRRIASLLLAPTRCPTWCSPTSPARPRPRRTSWRGVADR